MAGAQYSEVLVLNFKPFDLQNETTLSSSQVLLIDSVALSVISRICEPILTAREP